jgi:hypothetical protein
MRSELFFGAMTHVSNRLLLTKLAAMATRKLPRPNTREVFFLVTILFTMTSTTICSGHKRLAPLMTSHVYNNLS